MNGVDEFTCQANTTWVYITSLEVIYVCEIKFRTFVICLRRKLWSTRTRVNILKELISMSTPFTSWLRTFTSRSNRLAYTHLQALDHNAPLRSKKTERTKMNLSAKTKTAQQPLPLAIKFLNIKDLKYPGDFRLSDLSLADMQKLYKPCSPNFIDDSPMRTEGDVVTIGSMWW